MVGVGRAAGRGVSSAAVSANVGVASELPQTVESDAKHTAEEIAKVLKKFFADQGLGSSVGSLMKDMKRCVPASGVTVITAEWCLLVPRRSHSPSIRRGTR